MADDRKNVNLHGEETADEWPLPSIPDELFDFDFSSTFSLSQSSSAYFDFEHDLPDPNSEPLIDVTGNTTLLQVVQGNVSSDDLNLPIGVFTKEFMLQGTAFGPHPLKHVEIKPEKALWLLDCDGRPVEDFLEEYQFEWMPYVQKADENQPHNLEAFVFEGKLYYRCTTDIAPLSALVLPYDTQACSCSRNVNSQCSHFRTICIENGQQDNSINQIPPQPGKRGRKRKLENVAFLQDKIDKVKRTKQVYNDVFRIEGERKVTKKPTQALMMNSTVTVHSSDKKLDKSAVAKPTIANPVNSGSVVLYSLSNNTLLLPIANTNQATVLCRVLSTDEIYRLINIRTPGSGVMTSVAERNRKSNQVAHQTACTTCGQVLHLREDRQLHRRYHHCLAKLHCNFCQMKFSNRWAALVHKHVQSRGSFSCRFCAKGFSQISVLWQHIPSHFF